MNFTVRPALVYLFLPCFLLFYAEANGQLKADFSVDKEGGCSPLVVRLTNTSTGFSGNITWSWDFGNGNSSDLKNPSAVFQQEGSYTITLTVKEGNASSVKSRTITVYKKPEFDFIVSPASGCTPLQTVFNASKTGGDGTITKWHWDFGDGSTETTTSPTINHLYEFKQTSTVSLTAVSNYGCAGTRVKENAVTVKDSVRVQFQADRIFACSPDATINFTNNSTGAGVLGWLWEFGDGSTSTQKSPTHIYKSRGRFSVSLTVSSSEGCTLKKTEKDFINVGDFSSDFQPPPVNCENKEIFFRNTSSPKPVSSKWYVDGQEVFAAADSGLKYGFPSSGKYTIKLVNVFGNCQQEISKQITVHKNPKLDSFIIEQPIHCTSPFQVRFRDTSHDAVKWRWNFNYYWWDDEVHSTLQNPAKEYAYEGIQAVRLETENAEGCVSTIVQTFDIQRLRVRIVDTDNTSWQGCDKLTKKFETSSIDPVVKFLWDFGDGTTSTEAKPEHTYTKQGEYKPRLTYTTASGCTGTVEYHTYLSVVVSPKIDFTIQPEVCGNTWVHAQGSYGGNYEWIKWDFGDNTPEQYNGEAHRYQKEGVYTIKMIALNYTCGNDTIEKKNIIRVKGPFPRIERVDYTCDGDRSTISIIDSSHTASKWTWDFGDGTNETYTTHKPVVTHSFPKSSNYMVRLTVEKDQCVLKDSVIVYILKKQKPVLTMDNPVVCVNSENEFHVRGLEYNIYILSDPMNRYWFEKFEYKDGTQFNGNFYNQTYYWYENVDGIIIPNAIKNDSIRLITTSYFHNCQDTTNYVPFVVKGAISDFKVENDNQCYKSPVIFRDLSSAVAGSNIVKRVWDFGDGHGITTTGGGTVSHLYEKPGYYYVTLNVTDAGGCTSSKTMSAGPVQVRGVEAIINVSPALTVQEKTQMYFSNYAEPYYALGKIKYQWSFGDGATSTGPQPVHAYQKPGNYTVQLIVTDAGSNCSDTATVKITVSAQPVIPDNTKFTSTTAFIGDNGACPPVKAAFSFSSNMAYTRLIWDFGDGFTLENQNNPSHIYSQTGTYTVRLQVYNNTVLAATMFDTVVVSKPPSAISAPDLSACIGDEMKLFAPVKKNGYNYSWDFGNGYVFSNADSIASGIYRTPGSYTPSVIITDQSGCASSVRMNKSIVVHPDPVISVSPSNALVCQGEGVQLQASGAAQYSWLPAAGLNNPSISNPLATPAGNTSYTVSATDLNGCKATAMVSVTVPQPIHLQVGMDADICKGAQTQLSAAGAFQYQWINAVDGLSNTQTANPIAAPQSTATYTLVGYDQYHCWSDTAQVTVNVRPNPEVQLGPDLELSAGTPTVLQGTYSADVIRWLWSPANNLSCNNCATPTAIPRGDIEYSVKVFNQYNCTGEDAIRIKTLCTDGNINIPNAFTPDGDGLNDLFRIPAFGVSRVIHFRIFNSWGQLIFEKKDFAVGDPAGSWDGRLKGIDQPAGAYVYFVEIECTADKRFQKKGTVMLIRR